MMISERTRAALAARLRDVHRIAPVRLLNNRRAWELQPSPELTARQRRPARHVSARARCPASVIITQTTSICRLPARMVPGCVVARPSRTRRASSSALRPCASRNASVQSRGLPASSLSARRCSALMLRRTLVATARPSGSPAPGQCSATCAHPVRVGRASLQSPSPSRPPVRPVIVAEAPLHLALEYPFSPFSFPMAGDAGRRDNGRRRDHA
jgi:hypothetical protein